MRRIALSLAMMMTLLTAMPATAGAFDPFGGACGGGNSDSAACKANGSDPIAGPNGVLVKATNIIAFFAGAIAVIMIIVSSIKLITSGSDMSTGSRTDTDVEEARRGIANALLGLVVILLAKFIITYVVRRL